MKYLKLFENKNNVSCVEFLKYAKETTLGNPESFSGLMDTAEWLDQYYEGTHHPGPGEDGWYTIETLNKFKELVKSMLEDERRNYPPDYDFNDEDTRHQVTWNEWEESKKYNL